MALFHRPAAEPPLQTGRRFYRLWLECAGLGLSAAPMAVLADDIQTSAALAQRYGRIRPQVGHGFPAWPITGPSTRA